MKQTIQNKTHRQSGQTLIEVMTVMFVLTVGIMGALGLTVANVRNESMGLTRLIASNLAREGVEISRSIRDSNWLKGQAWDTGLGTDIDKRCARLNEKNLISLDVLSCSANTVVQADVYRIFRAAGDGTFIQNSSAPPDTKTSFYRKIEFKPLCLDPVSSLVDACVDWDTKVGLRVISEVGWTDQQGHAKSVKATEELMNWR